MNEVISEWVTKAEGDFATASRELEAAEKPNYDAVCFHAQQCVEKMMKAVLILNGITPPRTHDLIWLNELMTSLLESWDWPRPELRLLTRAAVEFRYPGEAADKRGSHGSSFDCLFTTRQAARHSG